MGKRRRSSVHASSHRKHDNGWNSAELKSIFNQLGYPEYRWKRHRSVIETFFNVSLIPASEAQRVMAAYGRWPVLMSRLILEEHAESR